MIGKIFKMRLMYEEDLVLYIKKLFLDRFLDIDNELYDEDD